MRLTIRRQMLSFATWSDDISLRKCVVFRPADGHVCPKEKAGYSERSMRLIPKNKVSIAAAMPL